MRAKLLGAGLALALLSACSGNPQQDAATAQSYIVAFQPLASEVACKAQAAANLAGAQAQTKGDTNGAQVASTFSQANGLFCDGLPAGAPLPQPVTVPATGAPLGAAPPAAK